MRVSLAYGGEQKLFYDPSAMLFDAHLLSKSYNVNMCSISFSHFCDLNGYWKKRIKGKHQKVKCQKENWEMINVN